MLAMLLAACSAPGRGPVVLAAVSLTEAMEDVADAWAAKGHARPVLSLAGTAALARQVEGGAPADVFISADEQWMDWLDERGLVAPGTRVDLLGNRLVLVGTPESQRAWLEGRSFAAAVGDCPIAMADPESVPAGRYARAALRQLGAWDAISGQVIPTENVRAALALVERGEVECGITYVTDFLASDRVVMLGQFPPGAGRDIHYPAGLVAASAHPDAAALLAFLASEEAAAIFRRHGFVSLRQ